MRVRRATPRDLDRLTALASLLFAAHEPAGARFALAPDDGAALQALLRGLARDGDRLLLVAERDGGSLDGFALAAVLHRSPAFAERARGEIEWLFVREPARRRGVGRRLVEAARVWLAEHGVARVEVHVERANAAGRAFWSAQGFVASMDVLERPL